MNKQLEKLFEQISLREDEAKEDFASIKKEALELTEIIFVSSEYIYRLTNKLGRSDGTYAPPNLGYKEYLDVEEVEKISLENDKISDALDKLEKLLGAPDVRTVYLEP